MNVGCIPTKALVRTAELIHLARRPENAAFGFTVRGVSVDFPQVIARKDAVVADVVGRLTRSLESAEQGLQFPIARAHAALEAANLMRLQAAALFDAGEKCGAEANLAKLLCSEASWQAANAAMDAHGGYGFAEEYDIERKFRETRLYITAPVSNNLILAFVGQHVLGMPRSY